MVVVVKVKLCYTASNRGSTSHWGSIRAGSIWRTTPYRVSNRCKPNSLQLLPHPRPKEEDRGPQPGPKETAELPARPQPTSLGPATRRRPREDNSHPESPGWRRSGDQPHLRGPSRTPGARLGPSLPRKPTAHRWGATLLAPSALRSSRGLASSYWSSTTDGDQ